MNRIMIDGKRYVLFWLLSFLTVLFLVVFGYLRFSPLDRMSAEDFLFLGIIILGGQILFAFLLAAGHYKVKGRLKRISRIGDLAAQDSQKILSGLGDIGGEINALLDEQNRLAKLRAGRIAALNQLARMLCLESGEPLLYTDVKGVVLGYSENLTDRAKLDDLELMGREITELWPQIPLGEVVQTLQKQRLLWSDPENSGLTCTPVFDGEETLHFCLWSLGTGFLKRAPEPRGETPARGGAKGKVSLADLLNRVRKR